VIMRRHPFGHRALDINCVYTYHDQEADVLSSA
jgi:hypothetical protein